MHKIASRLERKRWLVDKRSLPLYLIMLPALVYFIVYRYVPMAGLIMVFKKYRITRGILASPWCGLDNFITLFSSPSFGLILRNTILISFYKLLFAFPAPIIAALMLNALKSRAYKRTLQTALYLPHFISWVVLGSLVFTFFAPSSGVLTQYLSNTFGISLNLMMDPTKFRSLLVGSDIWKEVGWGSIIYLATLVGIDATLYEAAVMDGASKRQQLWYITMPCLVPTIMTMLLLRVVRILDAGFEQIYVLQNPLVYDVSEIIDTYVYKLAFSQGQHAVGAAAGLFKSVIGLMFVLGTNQLAKSFDQEVL